MPDITGQLTAALADRYRIERHLGEGGMATVYLAEDLKHGREVAIKVLRPELAESIGGARFLREVHIAARLTHPHILGLHDSGEAAGFLYYVMPFVEGDSLRDRLTRDGELPISDAVRVLRDAVDALAYAHERNVVHRDIKPDNVMIAGRHALVTDFGVAKALSEASGGQSVTTAGVALGTPAYMAPEQAAGEPVDHRADLYAVGVLAYEILTGHPPFEGGTVQQVLAAHVTQPPRPPSERRAAIPAALDAIVLRCLEKRPADRYQTAESMLAVLEGMATPTAGVTPTHAVATTQSAPPRVGRLIALSGATVAIAVFGFLGWSSLQREPAVPTISNYRTITRDPGPETDAVLSPDGRAVVYEAITGNELKIYVRDLAGGRPIALTADRPGSQRTPRWMPDGVAITFVERGTTYVIPRFGGPSRTLLEGAVVWGIHGEWVAYSEADTNGRRQGLYVRRLDGTGTPIALSTGGGQHPAVWSPDGQRLAFVTGNTEFMHRANIGPASIWVVDRDGGEPIPIVDDGRQHLSPAWLPDGRHLLLVSDRDGPRDLYMVRLDNDSRPDGDPVRISNGLEAVSVSLSADGRNAVYGRFVVRGNLWSLPIPASGPVSITDAEPVLQSNEIIEQFAISRDGRWLAFDSNREGNQDIYLMPLAGGEARRLTSDPADDFSPDFSPDGSEIAFYSTRHGPRDIFIIRSDGTGERRLTDYPRGELHPKFSPDGKSLVFDRFIDGEFSAHIMLRNEIRGTWSDPVRIPGVPGHVASGTEGVRWSVEGNLARRTQTQIISFTPDGQFRVLVDAAESGLTRASVAAWSADGQTVYMEANAAGLRGLFAVPVSGGSIRPLVWYDHPELIVWDWAAHEDRLYVTVKQIDADVIAFDLEY